MNRLNMCITTIFLAVIMFSQFALAKDVKIRVYCFHNPPGKPETYFKLMRQDKPQESVKVDARSRPDDFALDAEKFEELVKKCENLIKLEDVNSKFTQIKGSDASWHERLTRFHPINQIDVEKKPGFDAIGVKDDDE